MLKINNVYLQETFFKGETEVDGLFLMEQFLFHEDILSIADDIIKSNREVKVDEGKIPLLLVIVQDDEDEILEMIHEDEPIHVKTIRSKVTPLDVDKYSEQITEAMQKDEFKLYQLIGILIDDMMIDFEDCVDISSVFEYLPIMVADSALL